MGEIVNRPSQALQAIRVVASSVLAGTGAAVAAATFTSTGGRLTVGWGALTIFLSVSSTWAIWHSRIAERAS